MIETKFSLVSNSGHTSTTGSSHPLTSGGGYLSITYIDGIFEHSYHLDGSNAMDEELNELHVMDDQTRVAMLRTGYDDGTPFTKYILSDHLGSSNVILETSGAVYNREEYYPFGETSFGAFGKKRYRYVGKEKDEESGLYYYGARYFQPWSCRFISVDPLAADYPFYTPYQYAGNQPINFIDLDGKEQTPAQNGNTGATPTPPVSLTPPTPPDAGQNSSSYHRSLVEQTQLKSSNLNFSVLEVNLQREGIKAFKLQGSTMTPFVSGSNTLSTAGKEMNKPNSTEITINAQFLEKDRATNQGQSFANGQSLGGSSQPGWYYMASDGKGGYTFATGNPPTGSQNAIGGGRPLIIDGLPYGDKNLYKPGAPKNLPTSGDVSPDAQKYIIQKSAAYYSKQNTATVGKTVVAYNPNTKSLMVIAQEDGSNGLTMDQIRSYLMNNGYTYALSFDGSDSSMLIKDSQTLISNSLGKDLFTNSGITFSIPQKR